MQTIEMLQQFNECYAKIQAIAQSQEWLELSNRNDVDPEVNYPSLSGVPLQWGL